MFRAQGLTERFAPNRNIALPRRPGFTADMVALHLPQGALAYVGSTAPILLHGRSVNELLPALLPLLRGDLALADVIERAGRALRPAVDDLLHFLFARGLLVEHDGQPRVDGAAMRRHALFFERYCSELTLASGAEPAQKLRDGRVLLVGAAAWRASLREALEAIGLPVHDADPEDLGAAGRPAGLPTDAPVLALATPATLARLAPAQRALAAAQAWRWMPIELRRGDLVIGPLSTDGIGARPDAPPATTDAPGSAAPLDPTLSTAAAHAVLMVLADAATAHWTVNRLRLDARTLEWHCEGAPRPAAGGGFIADYHLNTQDRPVRRSARQHLVSYEPAQVDKVRGACKPYSGASWAWDAPAGSARDPLARLLGWAAQCVRWRLLAAQMPMRPVPAAGNLASQSLYLVNRRADDPRAGVHYLHPDGRAYRVADAAALQASTGKSAGASIGAALTAALGGAEVGLVATAALARLESKYGHKAYRFAHYDAGVLLAALQALAGDEGAALACTADLDDTAVETLLGLDGRTELVCWLATLTTDSPARACATAEE